MRMNTIVQRSPGLNWLTEDQCEDLHFAAMDILERIGSLVNEEESRKLLKNAGARVEDNKVFVPSTMVEKALATIPRHFAMYNREGEPAMYLEPGRVYFGTGSDTQYTLDVYTGKRRLSVKEDVGNIAKITDALPDLDFVMSMALPSDCSKKLFHNHQVEQMILNSTKPFIYTGDDRQDVADALKMCELAAGGEKRLMERPFSIHYAQPSSPLKHPEESLQRLLLCAEKRAPVLYASALMLGASGPVTMAGSLAISIAESLLGIVIHQLKQPGAPLVFGVATPALDMQTSLCTYGSPEEHMGGCISAALARYYKVPTFSVAGATDACTVDPQAGMESAYTILMHALSGSNLIHDFGYMAAGTTSSPELVILGSEMVKIVKYMMKGLEINTKTLALDVIEKVGPGGDFLMEDHTIDNFRTSLCYTETLNRYDYLRWEKEGKKDFNQRAREKAIDILEHYKVPDLPEGIVKKIKEVPLERERSSGE